MPAAEGQVAGAAQRVGMRRGVMLVISSPSGAGKTTLANALLAADPGISPSISVTTRPPRPGEVDGREYHFRDIAGFERLKAEGALLEWAHVHGNLYGTPKADVMERLAAGRDVLFDIDWQGADQLADRAPSDVVRVFILPPSFQVLRERLEKRAQDKPEVVARRLAGAAEEIAHWRDYDYVLVNDDIARCSGELSAILAAERLKRTRRPGIAAFVAGLG